jgi:uroporphyrinogen decarboxylase
MMNARENFLQAIRFGRPERVPLANEGIWHSFELEGNFRRETWTDHWGVRWEVGIEGTVPFPKGNPLRDLERFGEYRFPNPGDLVLTAPMKNDLARVDRGEKLVRGNLTYLLFERAWAIMGMENFLESLVTRPAESHALLHGIATYARAVFDRYLELGVDAIGLSEDLGSQRALMISPRMFREFILPEYGYIFDNVLAERKLIHFHSCGCVEAVVADLADIGVSILNPVQARANDLRKVKSATLGRMALEGGIDAGLLVNGSPADVRHEVIRVLVILKPGGGYICGPDQNIPGIPKENTQSLWYSVTGQVTRGKRLCSATLQYVAEHGHISYIV